MSHAPAQFPHQIRIRHAGAADAATAHSAPAGRLMWIFPLALIVRLTLFSRRRDIDDFNVVDSYASAQIAIIAVSILAVLLSGRARAVWRRIAGTSSSLLVALYLFGALSAFWSPAPAFSLYRAVEVLSQVAVIYVALSFASGYALAERRVLVLVVFSMLLDIVSVARLYGFRFSLEHWHTNQYTVPAVIAFVYCFGEYLAGSRRNPLLLRLVGAAAFAGLLLGTSTASFVAALCGMLVALYLSPAHARKIFVILALSLAVIAIGIAEIQQVVFYGKSEEKIEHLSGRKFIWTTYLREFPKAPFLGHGFAVSARISEVFKTTNTHNSAISVLLGMGLAGLALACAAFYRFLREARSAARARAPGSVGATAALCAGLVNSMSVAFLGETYMLSSFSFLCMMALFTLFVANGGRGPSGARRLIVRRA